MMPLWWNWQTHAPQERAPNGMSVRLRPAAPRVNSPYFVRFGLKSKSHFVSGVALVPKIARYSLSRFFGRLNKIQMKRFIKFFVPIIVLVIFVLVFHESIYKKYQNWQREKE